MDWLKSAKGRLGEIGAGLIESISWKLAAELHHRHSEDLKIIECHPGGGQYDCLSFVKGGDIIGELNRSGGFTGFARESHIPWEGLWPKAMTDEGLQETLDDLCRGCGIEAKEVSGPASPGTLAYRVMAAVTMFQSYGKAHWEWRNGQCDTLGESDQPVRDQWFVKTGMEDELINAMREKTRLGGRYDFWFLLKDDEPKCCITTQGELWARGKPCIELLASKDHHPNVVGLAKMVINSL